MGAAIPPPLNMAFTRTPDLLISSYLDASLVWLTLPVSVATADVCFWVGRPAGNPVPGPEAYLTGLKWKNDGE